MEEFKNFDENIKNKLSEEEFPFDESNWEKAAKMIDDSRQPKKRYGWIVIASLIFVGTSVLLFNTFKDDGKSSQSDIVLNDGNKTQDVRSKTEEIEGMKGIQENKESGTKNQDLRNETQYSRLKTEGTQESGLKTQDTRLKTEGTKEETKEVGSKTQVTEGTKKTVETQVVKKEATNISKNENSIPKTEKKNKIIKEENTNAVALNNTNETKTTEVKVSPEIEKKKTGTKTPEEKQIISTKNKETTEHLNNETTKQPNNIEKENQLAGTTNPSVTVTINSKPDSTIKPIEKIVASAPLDSIRKTDSVKTIVETKTETKKEEIKSEPFYKNIISVEAGASYLFGWQNSGSTEGNGFNPIGGINYSHFFTKKIGVMIGLQYNSVSNFINNTTLTKDSIGSLITGGSVSANTHYDFGVQNDIQIINVTKLHYIVMPIKIQYQLKKNIFGVGCNLAAIFNSDNSVETYTERNNSAGQHTITKTTGYYVGAYNTVNVQLGAFYRRKIYKGLSVNAEFLYGLSDVKNNSFFKSNAAEKNIGFKLTLCYDLFKK